MPAEAEMPTLVAPVGDWEQNPEADARTITGGRSTCALRFTSELDPSLPEIVKLPLGPDPSARPLRSMEAVIAVDSPPFSVPD